MEYRIVKPISIYELIQAGVSKEIITMFERKACLTVTEILSIQDDEWFFRWVVDTGYDAWFVEKGFIEEVSEKLYRAGDKFVVIKDPGNGYEYTLGAQSGNCGEVMLVRFGVHMRIVSLSTGMMGDYLCRLAKDGGISEEMLSRMVKSEYGDNARQRRVF